MASAAWVPFGAAEVEEREIGFLFLHRVGVDAQRDLGARMAELARDPGDALPRREREARECMSSVVESKRANALLLGLTAEAIPAPTYVAFVEWAARLRAEDERRWFLPLALQRGPLALFEEIAKNAFELVGHHDESSPTALRSSELTTDEGASDVDPGFVETNVFPPQPQSFTSAAPRREKECDQGIEPGFRRPSDIQECGDFGASPRIDVVDLLRLLPLDFREQPIHALARVSREVAAFDGEGHDPAEHR